MSSPIVVLFALRREALAWRDPNIETHVTGMGWSRAWSVIRDRCQRQPMPSLVIAAGFAGGVCASLPVGAIFQPAEIVDETGRCWPANALPHAQGRLLTVSRLIAAPDEKRLLAVRTQAQAVDMESAAIAAVCHDHGILFACVRVITDAHDDGLSPELAEWLVDGRMAWSAVARSLIRRPSLLMEMLRLARITRRAADRLAVALAQAVATAQSSNSPSPNGLCGSAASGGSTVLTG